MRAIILSTTILVSGYFNTLIAQDRTISFPDDWQHASISLYEQPKLSDKITGHFTFAWEGRSLGAAAGDVHVPSDAFVGIELDAHEGYEEFLSSLPRNGIHRLVLNRAVVSTSLLQLLEQLESLRDLTFTDCVASHVDVSRLHGSSQLQNVACRQTKDPAELHRVIVPWVAKSPQVQDFYDGVGMTADELHLFRQHRAPLFVQTDFDTHASAVIAALQRIPNLVGLNAHVSPTVPDNYHRDLPSLEKVEWINWNNGQLDGSLLESLGKLPRLHTLRFQGRCKATDQFVERLVELKNLTAISLSFPLSPEQAEILPEVILSMEGIRETPKLRRLTADQFQKLSKRSNLERLRISGLDESVSSKQLADVIVGNTQLTSLELSDIDLTKEIASAICQCRKLTHLDISVSGFSGALLHSLDQLKSLRELYLRIDGHAEGLGCLADLPDVRYVSVELNTSDPADYSFIGEMKSLRSLRIIGYCDDSIVRWIKQNEMLHSFQTIQDCIMTEAGVEELCECQQMESLSVGGFISADGIEKLGRLPKLSRLSVSSDLPDEAARARLRKRFEHLDHFDLRELNPTVGAIAMGSDHLYRQVPDEGRGKFDALEGDTLEEMLGLSLTEELRQQLAHKVVLVDFWGTWCGPCLSFVPELERLQEQYGEHGFQVLAIHSQASFETAEAYIKEYPKPWPNLIDRDGEIATRFAVPSYPSVYVFGRDGTLSVSLAHRYGLDRTIQLLLQQ